MNREVAQRRADAVAKYLVELGVPQERIVTSSLGSSKPLVVTAPQTSEISNRRVEIVVGRLLKGGSNMQDRHIGDVRVTRIEEQMGPGFPAKDFFPEFDADTFAAEGHWLAPSYYQPESGRLMTSIHSWLLRTGKHTILVDACSGNHKPRPGMPRFDMLNTQYLERLREAGVEPEEIDFVMCTHLHVDHVGWNTRLENGKWVPTFPNAKYVMSRTDHDFWEAEAKRPGTEAFKVNTYNDSVLPIVEAKKAEFVTGEHGMCGCLTLKPAPGHTPGQIRVDLDFARQAGDLRG